MAMVRGKVGTQCDMLFEVAALMISLSFVLPAAAAPALEPLSFAGFIHGSQSCFRRFRDSSKQSHYPGRQSGDHLSASAAMGWRNEEYVGKQYGDANLAAEHLQMAAADKARKPGRGTHFLGDGLFLLLFFSGQSDQRTIRHYPNGSGDWVDCSACLGSQRCRCKKGVGAVNTLQVQTKGKAATLFVNGQQVGTFTGAPPSGGGVVGFTVSTSLTGADTWDVSDFSVAVP